MELRLPITTVNGEPIEDLVRALRPLVRTLSDSVDALVRGEPPAGHLVLVPCVKRALLPIWLELWESNDLDIAEITPGQAFTLLLTIVETLVDQIDQALQTNARQRAA